MFNCNYNDYNQHPVSNSQRLHQHTCALDYLHLVCLGAVRCILMFWKAEDRTVKLSSSQLMEIPEKLIALRDIIPSEFARRTRSVAERNLVGGKQPSIDNFCYTLVPSF